MKKRTQRILEATAFTLAFLGYVGGIQLKRRHVNNSKLALSRLADKIRGRKYPVYIPQEPSAPPMPTSF